MQSERIAPFKLLKGPDLHKDDVKLLSAMKALVAEMDTELPNEFKDFNSSERDLAFKVAFDRVATKFQNINEGEEPRRKKAKENTSFMTLYSKSYSPNKAERKAPPAPV